MVDVDVRISSHLKEELVWTVDKWLWVISTTRQMLEHRGGEPLLYLVST